MIQVINRAFDILEIMAQDLDKKYTLGEISEKLGLNHATCANIIKTMVNRGYVENVGRKRGYCIGRQTYLLTNNFQNKNTLIEATEGPLRELREKLNESCILAILRKNIRVTLLKETSTHDLQAHTSEEKDAYSTATGRMLLASKNAEELNLFVKSYGLPESKWKEVKTFKGLVAELIKIKEKQLAIHHAESDIIGLGVPIYCNNVVIASLGVYLPELRFKGKKQTQILQEIKKTANYISKQLK